LWPIVSSNFRLTSLRQRYGGPPTDPASAKGYAGSAEAFAKAEALRAKAEGGSHDENRLRGFRLQPEEALGIFRALFGFIRPLTPREPNR
jgi:hypothetical protein